MVNGNFRAWLRQIARNKVMNHHKKLKRSGMLVFDESLLARFEAEMEPPSPEDVEKKRQALTACFGRLTPENQSLLRARYTSAADLSQHSAASGRSHESLRVTLFRLRGWLRKCIDQRLAQGGGV
jgi:RNA polymerase sigma-70 factor (ECF subfamily)